MKYIIAVFLRVIWIKMSNGTMHRKSTSRSCCLHDSSHAGKPVLLFLAHVGSQECACTEAYYYYPCPAAQWSLWQRTLGWVGRGTGVLNNLYVEHVFRRSMRNARTHLIWHRARNLSSLRKEGLKEWKRKAERTRLKGLSVFSLDHPFHFQWFNVYSSLVTLDDLSLFFYHEGDKYSNTDYYTVPQTPT